MRRKTTTSCVVCPESMVSPILLYERYPHTKTLNKRPSRSFPLTRQSCHSPFRMNARTPTREERWVTLGRRGRHGRLGIEHEIGNDSRREMNRIVVHRLGEDYEIVNEYRPAVPDWIPGRIDAWKPKSVLKAKVLKKKKKKRWRCNRNNKNLEPEMYN